MPEINGNAIPPNIEKREYKDRLILSNAFKLQKENKRELIAERTAIIKAKRENKNEEKD